MKKTLFAMLAFASMLPAMGANWSLKVENTDPYKDILTKPYNSFYFSIAPQLYSEYIPSNYTLYLMLQEDSDKETVKTRLEGTTFSDFTTTIAIGNGIAYDNYDPGLNGLTRNSYVPTELPDTISLSNIAKNIWGICVYQHDDVVRFQVLQVSGANSRSFSFDTARKPGSGYTSFSSVPEPATATLSLLALAGLAARRKRK